MTFTPEPLDPADPRPPYEQVTRSLAAAIWTGQLEPGDRVPPQIELSARYGVARATVQRALRELEARGLVVVRKGTGVYVRNWRAPVAASVMSLALDLRVDPVRLCGLLIEHGFLTDPGED